MILINIGFVGAGKVGFSLGKYFVENNISIVGYYSRSLSSAIEASNFTGTKSFFSLKDLIYNSDIIFITTPDDEIYNLWMSIKTLDIRGKIICHTSGNLSSNIFSCIEESDAYSYSIHPIYPISDKYTAYKNLKEAFFTIEGHEKYMDTLIHIFSTIGNKIIPLNSKDKTLYHLAAVTVSNLFCGLISRASNYLREYGFEEKDSIEALYPLMISNINNIVTKGIEGALTGPIERNDVSTIKQHLEVIPEAHKAVYKNLSEELLKISIRKHGERNFSKLKNYLGELK